MINTIAMVLGYVVMVSIAVGAIAILIFTIQDHAEEAKLKAEERENERFNVKLAALRQQVNKDSDDISDIMAEITNLNARMDDAEEVLKGLSEDLCARVNAIENVIDQFRPAKGFGGETK